MAGLSVQVYVSHIQSTGLIYEVRLVILNTSMKNGIDLRLS